MGKRPINRIVSFNLRCALEWNAQEDENLAHGFDGENAWKYRKSIVVDYIKDVLPDVICFQEAQPKMVSYLEEKLGEEYGFCGTGRLAESKYFDEMCKIAYNKRAVTLVEDETFWLSPTPSVPGSKFEGQYSNIPRICTKAKFKSLTTGEEFFVYNAHLCLYEHIIHQQYAMIEKDIAKQGAVCFLCGDLNTTPNKIIGEYNEGLYDLTENVEYTFNHFGLEKKKIDYIICNKKLNVAAYISKIIKNGVYISDHYPLTVDLAE